MSNLNIQSNIQKLVIEALNCTDTQIEAARALGITWRTLYNYKRQFNIVKIDDKYEILQVSRVYIQFSR